MSIRGKTIVFTGRVSKPRHEFQALVEEHGGIAGSDVSRATDYLVVGDKPGSKLAKATLLGIKIISEPGFLDLLKESKEDYEVPATPEELKEFENHTLTITCAYCGHKYKQWDTLPNYETCPFCAMDPSPLCPHCSHIPTFVTDFSLYHCMLCGTWFKAPFSIRARKTKHLHYWHEAKQTSTEVVKKCFCGASIKLSFLEIEEDRKKYEEAPSLEGKRRREDQELKEARKKEEEYKQAETDVLKKLAALSQEELLKLSSSVNSI